jgi:hypothetical protein
MSGLFNRLLDLRLLLIAAVVVTASSSCAHATDKEVARGSSATVNAHVVELVNAARSNGRNADPSGSVPRLLSVFRRR